MCGPEQHERRNKEANIKNPRLALTAVAVLLGGLLLLKSDATALPGLVGPPAPTKNTLQFKRPGVFWLDAIVALGSIGSAACHLILSGADATACRVRVRTEVFAGELIDIPFHSHALLTFWHQALYLRQKVTTDNADAVLVGRQDLFDRAVCRLGSTPLI